MAYYSIAYNRQMQMLRNAEKHLPAKKRQALEATKKAIRREERMLTGVARMLRKIPMHRRLPLKRYPYDPCALAQNPYDCQIVDPWQYEPERAKRERMHRVERRLEKKYKILGMEISERHIKKAAKTASGLGVAYMLIKFLI